jgi:hypothetical protein
MPAPLPISKPIEGIFEEPEAFGKLGGNRALTGSARASLFEDENLAQGKRSS